MSNYTQSSYECSRQNASITYGEDNTEWENEFKEGIELKKGDMVRLLGSFVHQGSDATEIEVEKDMELNVSYSPFIVADTIDTLDTTADGSLQNLSDIGDICYSTDSFGIEPPQRVTTQNGTTKDGTLNEYEQCNFKAGAEKSFPSEDVTVQPATTAPNTSTALFKEQAYSDPVMTAERGGDTYGLTSNYWSINTSELPGASARKGMLGDRADTFGLNMKTDELFTDNNKVRLDYANFADGRANCEMYVGNMVKKLILPVFDSFSNANTTANPKADADQGPGIAPLERTLDPLISNPPPAGVGMLNGMPKVGMCIATVNIAQSSGWYDADGNAYWENNWDNNNVPLSTFDGTVTGGSYIYAGCSGYTGVPNLAGGVESVIGTIIATRPILHNIMGRSTPCWELMVSDFINPATLTDKPIVKGFNSNRLTNAATFATSQTPVTINCFKKVHGSGTSETNANFNPSINNINGAYGQITQSRSFNTDANRKTGYKTGMFSNTPTRNNYLLNDPDNGPNYRTEFETGGAGTNASYNQMGLGQNQGLSFLWNGSHTGYLRYNDTVSNVDRYRANHLLKWDRTNGDDEKLIASSKIHDIRLVERGGVSSESFFRNAALMEMGSVPVAFGAYIITKKETMLDIAKGVYTNVNNYWNESDTQQPRIWFDFAYQQTDSNYKVRHMKGNSYDTRKINTGDAIGGTDTIFPAGGGSGQPRAPPFVPDIRHGYSMCGRPLNINYRNSSGENGNANRALAYNYDDTFPLSGNSRQNQQLELATTDFMPRYFNTPTGATNFPVTKPQSEDAGYQGLPGVWGGYNTTINSIYFQQKETGDTKLGSTSLRSNGFCHANTNIGVNPRTIDITKATLIRSDDGQLYPPFAGNFIRIVGINNCQFQNTTVIDTVTDNGLFYTITIPATTRFYEDIIIDTPVVISNGPSFMDSAVGTNGKAWAGDHIMIREQFVKLKVDSGFYTEEQLAERINDQLHLNSLEYKQNYGIKNLDGTYNLPSTEGNKERNLASQPSILNGNFVNTYLPDINYGFSPITTTNATALGLTASTKEITNELLTYEPLDANNITYYWPELIPTVTTTETYIRKLTDHSTQYPTILGKHFKMYTIPTLDKEQGIINKEINLVRLKGGSLNTQLDFIQDKTDPAYWHNDHTRFTGSYEMLRDFTFSKTSDNFGERGSTLSIYGYRTRYTRNMFAAGGSSRVFVGANNFTFSWEEGANRYSFNNLYTPVRPHKRETNGSDNKDDFGIGDAIPSAIINSRPNGTIISQLSGIYINNLSGDLFTQANWGVPTIGNGYLYDIVDSAERQLKNTTFLNILGYSLNQIANFDNSFMTVQDIFLYKDFLTQSGSAIRIGAKISTSINASNPTASRCLTIAPVTQFMVQVDTDDFFAQNAPLKGNDPYFFIGSTFPFKQFFGNDNGGKLPIMGICARNFQAFGFSFDLGGSAVQYQILKDTTITSIRTKIYTSNLQSPTNLSPYSSIIYLITRYNYIKDVPPEIGAQYAKQVIAQNQAGMVNAYGSQPSANIRTYPTVNPDRFYFNGYGPQLPPIPEDDGDYDSD